MKRLSHLIIYTPLFLFLMSCSQTENPFFVEYDTPHGTAPFHLIKFEHYEPAVREGIRRHEAEIDAIASNTDAPTFANTIEALEHSGCLLRRVENVFGNLLSAETNDKMQELANELIPLTSEH